MGEVWKARDTRLDRIVAVKVAKANFDHRFEREARAIAALNHPNICQLYDVGPNYLVMELIDGVPLKGAIPAAKALEYAGQILDALDAAHRKGITHRDLKPANILLSKQGIKLLDFGLAKHTGPLTETDATEVKGVTGTGQIVGTLQYMSPEQLQGKPADTRSDIFAFGCVLYELLSGKRAFPGESSASVIAAILERDPAPLDTTSPIRRVVTKCLAKDPDERFQNSRDLKYNLGLAAEQSTPSASARLQWIPWAAAGLFAASTVGLGLFHFNQPKVGASLTKFSVPPPEKTTYRNLAVSPDGSHLAFVAADSDLRRRLWVRPFNSLAAQPLAETEDASFPFWSPDSRFIAYFTNGHIKKIAVSGGPSEIICNNSDNGRGGTWNADGTIIIGAIGGPLSQVPAAGGTPQPLTHLDSSIEPSEHRWPVFLPDGRHFLFVVVSRIANVAGIYIGSLDSKEQTRLLPDVSNVAYSNNHIIFWRAGALMAQRFNPSKFQLEKETTLLADGVTQMGPANLAAFSTSNTGVLVYSSTPGESENQLTWFDKRGNRQVILSQRGLRLGIWLSPDGKQLVEDFSDLKSPRDIWLVELARGISSRFTFDPAPDFYPVWSPDGSKIAFSSNREGSFNLYVKAADGGMKDELLLKTNQTKNATDWSLDGNHLLYFEFGAKTKRDLWVLTMNGADKGKSTVYLQTEFNEHQGTFSPDGKWVAYQSDSSGKDEIYLQPYPASGAKWQISKGGGRLPKWKRDGRELFYVGADRKMMSVPIVTGNAVQIGAPQPLFDTSIGALNTRYAVSNDGQRFLIPIALAGSTSAPATVVLNWTTGMEH